MNVQEEYASLVHRPWGSQNGGHPFIHVISLGTSTANIEEKKWTTVSIDHVEKERVTYKSLQHYAKRFFIFNIG